jgi:hypothetical protein
VIFRKRKKKEALGWSIVMTPKNTQRFFSFFGGLIIIVVKKLSLSKFEEEDTNNTFN